MPQRLAAPIKHLVWQPWCSAFRDCPLWDISVERDAYIRVTHVRRQARP